MEFFGLLLKGKFKVKLCFEIYASIYSESERVFIEFLWSFFIDIDTIYGLMFTFSCTGRTVTLRHDSVSEHNKGL